MNDEHRIAQQRIVLTILSIIDEIGEIPSGHLYAALMSHGMSYETYSTMLSALKKMKLVSESGFLLTITPAGRALVAVTKPVN